MIAHSWIFRILKLVQVSENIVQFIRKTLKKGTQSYHYVEIIWQRLIW